MFGRQYYTSFYWEQGNSNVNQWYWRVFFDYYNTTLFDTSNVPYNDGQLMGMSLYGSNISAWHNGSLVVQVNEISLPPDSAHTWWGVGDGGSALWEYWDNFCFIYYPADNWLYCQTYDNGTFISLGLEENYTAPIIMGVTWNSPINNSLSANITSILWNATAIENPTNCVLRINDISNYSMVISGNTCYYTTSSLTNGTKYCSVIYASNATASGKSGNQCQTIYTSGVVPPTPRPIDSLGMLGGVALLIMGAGIILFLLEGLFGSGALLRNPKGIMLIIIGAIIMVAMILALL
jgi:hypothetical protein